MAAVLDRVLPPLSAIHEAAWRLRMREDDLLFADYRDIDWQGPLEKMIWWRLRKRLRELELGLFE